MDEFASNPALEGREAYLRGIEKEEKRGQRFEALDAEDLESERAFRDFKFSESLSANGMHVITI